MLAHVTRGERRVNSQSLKCNCLFIAVLNCRQPHTSSTAAACLAKTPSSSNRKPHTSITACLNSIGFRHFELCISNIQARSHTIVCPGITQVQQYVEFNLASQPRPPITKLLQCCCCPVCLVTDVHNQPCRNIQDTPKRAQLPSLPTAQLQPAPVTESTESHGTLRD